MYGVKICQTFFYGQSGYNPLIIFRKGCGLYSLGLARDPRIFFKHLAEIIVHYRELLLA